MELTGMTLTSGFTYTPPPPENKAAWFGGGYNGPRTSTVQRIIYATDTATASVRGPLSGISTDLAAASNFTDGWFAGGGATGSSVVQRITYATETATASVRGPLSLARKFLGAAGNDTDGWFGGGYIQPSTSDTTTVDRITYATDTATASVRGPLSDARERFAAAGDTTYGYFAGGSHATFSAAYSIVDRITYATDTATASVRGPLSAARYFLAAASSPSDAWFGGGNNAGSRVDRITFATDTATASVRGPLTADFRRLAAAGGMQ